MRRLMLGALAVAAWVGPCAAGSVWLQDQAPVLVALRGGSAGAGAASQAVDQAPRPLAGPTATSRPLPETPSARYVVDLPREMSVSSGTALDVTVANTGREVWDLELSSTFEPCRTIPESRYPQGLAFRYHGPLRRALRQGRQARGAPHGESRGSDRLCGCRGARDRPA